MDEELKIRDILDALLEADYEFSFEGREDDFVQGFSSISQYRDGTLTWVKANKYLSNKKKDGYTCLVTSYDVNVSADNIIRTPDPRGAFFYLLQSLYKSKKRALGVGDNTVIKGKVIIPNDAIIGSNCVLDGDISIGAGTVIEHNVSIQNRVKIGENCIIHSGAVIGGDGFGYIYGRDKAPEKVEHFAGVVIGDRVEIGANACIDRGVIDDTTIGNDTKIDNMVHVAHNVRVGNNSLIVCQSALNGGCKVGDNVYISNGAVIQNGVEIQNNVFIGTNAIANKDIVSDSMVYAKASEILRNIDYFRFTAALDKGEI